MKMKFKAGDRVKVKRFKNRPINWNSDGLMDHLMGKIVEIKSVWRASSHITCEIYDEQYDRAWLMYETQVEPVDETIVIYRKDNEVIALDKNTGKKGIARGCPEDTFDFKTGAKLAFERLMSIDEAPTYYNGKIIFTKGDEIFKTGHIYEIKDGKLSHPAYDAALPSFYDYNRFNSIEDVRDYFTAKSPLHDGYGWSSNDLEFIEVKND